MVQSGLLDRCPTAAVGTIGSPKFNQHTRKFCGSPITVREVRYAEVISLAADLLQQWLFTRQRPREGATVATRRVRVPETLSGS